MARAATAHADLAVQLVLLAGVGWVVAHNLLHWPGTQFDEGTYMGNAWAVPHGALSNYTYGYGHPPLAWLLIFLWVSAGGLLGHASYSIDSGRELMLVVNLVSCSLLYTLARRLGFARVSAAAAVILFALSPLALFWHRAVLLDNPAIAWALAAFVLALTPRRSLWAFGASGACFAVSVLSKETTLVLLPALLLAAVPNADRSTRRYCVTVFFALFALIGLAYPLYATLKGELLPGRGHVSLLDEIAAQLFTRKASGNVFDPHSASHGVVTFWLHTDPWLLAAALVLTPIALARRTTRAVAVAFLIQVVMILRPGYLPVMYVLGLLPFAALIVVGSAEALWRNWVRVVSGAAAWRGWLRVCAIPLAPVVIGALAIPIAGGVAPHWKRFADEAMTFRADNAERAAERWLVDNVGHDKRLIVGDEFWIYLVEHGFDSRPVRGGFFSRTLATYWPFDYDPALKRQFANGWRDFDYIVSTQPMRDTKHLTPMTGQALDHSQLVVGFGGGQERIEIRAIIRAGDGGAVTKPPLAVAPAQRGAAKPRRAVAPAQPGIAQPQTVDLRRFR